MATLLELAVLALVPWPVLRLLTVPSIRREYARIAWSLVGVLILYVILLLWIALAVPVLLHPLAAGGVLILVADRWRARPSYGAARGLPPGSLSLFPRGPWVDEGFYRKEAERWGAIFKSSLLFRPCVCVLGARLGSELLRAHPDDLEAPRVRFNRFIPRGFLRYMEPEDHRVYKPPFRSAFSARWLAQNQPMMQEIVRRGLDRLAEESSRCPGEGVAPREPLREILFELLAWTYFRVRSTDDDFAWLRARYDDLDLRKASLVPDQRDREALAEIEAWVSHRGRASGAGDEPPCLLTALVGALPGALEDETALGNLVYTLTIGRADLTGLLMWTLKMLGDAPEWSERLRRSARSGAAGEARALAWCIVRETLRLEQSEYVYRRVRREIRFRGFTIPRHWRVRVLIREGHRDPAQFPEPERFDPGRWLEPGTPGASFQPFGLEAHACIGAALTESLSCGVLTELARGYDWEVVRDGPREYGWAHWQPSSKLRLELARAGPSATTLR